MRRGIDILRDGVKENKNLMTGLVCMLLSSFCLGVGVALCVENELMRRKS